MSEAEVFDIIKEWLEVFGDIKINELEKIKQNYLEAHMVRSRDLDGR